MSNSGNNTIEKFTPGGTGTVFASTGLNNPQGLALDSSGNLLVANAGSNTIMRFRFCSRILDDKKGGDEVDGGKEGFRQLVIAGGQTAKLF